MFLQESTIFFNLKMAEAIASANVGTGQDKSSTARDNGNRSNATLDFSGLSEQLAVSTSSGSNGDINSMASPFHSDLDDHVVAPVSGVKAARKVEHHDQNMFSDDECPKVLTTLEPVKKSTVSLASSGSKPHAIASSANVERIGGPSPVVVLNNIDVRKVVKPIEKPIIRQLNETLMGSRVKQPRKYSTFDVERKPAQPKKLSTSRHSIDSPSIRDFMIKQKNIRVLNNATVTKPATPAARTSSGTIEIPRDLLLAEAEIPASPVILNHVNTGQKMCKKELIAILEGTGESSNVEHFEVELEGDDLRTVPVANDGKKQLTKEEEREIAMQQILNLPVKKKGRPRLDSAQRKTNVKPIKTVTALAPTVLNAKAAQNDVVKSKLVKELVSDWDDPETDVDVPEEANEIVVEISEKPVQEVETKKRKIEVPEPTFKRQRVIKKKIIWDPDAPETAINYASYAHTSGPGAAPKRAANNRKSATPAPSDDGQSEKKIDVDTSSPASAAKKKKLSEIDKLLGDEGAKNMLESLNTNEGPTTKPSRKTTKPEPYVATIPAASARNRRKDSMWAARPTRETPPVKENSTNEPKKRAPKPSSSSWDYVYAGRADDSMIIRRRSNSSYSSNASPTRSSVDLAQAPALNDGDSKPATANGGGKEKKKNRVAKEREKPFEFAKPKKPTKLELPPVAEQKSILSEIRGKFNKAIKGEITSPIRLKDTIISPIIKKESKPAAAVAPSTSASVPQLDKLLGSYSELSLKWYKNFTQIILSPVPAGNGGRLKNLFTAQLMKEISSALLSLDLDKKCKAVLITSANSSFSNGIDFTSLIESEHDKRKNAAIELAKTTR